MGTHSESNEGERPYIPAYDVHEERTITCHYRGMTRQQAINAFWVEMALYCWLRAPRLERDLAARQANGGDGPAWRLFTEDRQYRATPLFETSPRPYLGSVRASSPAKTGY